MATLAAQGRLILFLRDPDEGRGAYDQYSHELYMITREHTSRQVEALPKVEYQPHYGCHLDQ